MGFSKLRVLNQDFIQPGAGFGLHSHRNMEIISYVVQGVLEHKDSMGNGSRIHPGDVQLMSAGTGVTHSEFNGSTENITHILQMWVLPIERQTRPRYAQKTFPLKERQGCLRLLVSPDGRQNSIIIGQDVSMYGGVIAAGQQVQQTLAPGRCSWVHLAAGRMVLNEQPMEPGDGAGVSEEKILTLTGVENAEPILFDLPL